MAERSRPLLVFDGDCGFCTSCARFVEARWLDRADLVAAQSLSPDELVALGLAPAQLAEAAYLVEPGRPPARGHLAVARALELTGGTLGLVGRALSVPPLCWLGPVAYRVVARSRHRLPGGTPACRVGASQSS